MTGALDRLDQSLVHEAMLADHGKGAPAERRIAQPRLVTIEHENDWRKAGAITQILQPFHAIAARPALREQHRVVALRQKFRR